MTANILIADDDTELCQLLADFLSLDDLSVQYVHDGNSAVRASMDQKPDLLVLDIMLPGLQGLDVLKSIRQQSELPIIMLTARGDDSDRILGLELGADDYLAKPCNPQELVARIKAVLRRTRQDDTEEKPPVNLRVADIELDSPSRNVTCKGNKVHLTSTEFDILRLLMQNAGEVVDKETISQQVLKRALSAYDRSIDVHISNIRKKLSSYDPDSEFIKNIRGVGYQLIVSTLD